MAYCTMDLVEYIKPSTGQTTFGSSSCPPDGFVRVEGTGIDFPPVENKELPLVRNEVRMTPQQIERAVKQETGGALVLASLAALVLLG